MLVEKELCSFVIITGCEFMRDLHSRSFLGYCHTPELN